MKLYVGNLVYNITESELSDLFAACGRVVTVRIIKDQVTRQSKNIGYVEMLTSGGGQRAVAKLHGKTFHDRLLIVKEAPGL